MDIALRDAAGKAPGKPRSLEREIVRVSLALSVAYALMVIVGSSWTSF